jgi:hypothetical protein
MSGTVKLYLQPYGSFHVEDTLERFVQLRNDDGSVAGLVEDSVGG